MQPTLITLAGLLSLVDAVAVTNVRAGFPVKDAATSSSVSSTTLSSSTKSSTTSSTSSATSTSIPARAGFPVKAATSTTPSTTSIATSTTSANARQGFPIVTKATTSSTTTSKTSTSTTSTSSTSTSTSSTTTTSSKTSTSTTMKTSTSTTSTKTTTTSAAATVSAGTTSTKRGLCWPYNNPASSFNLFSPSRETWLYNWEMWSPTGGTSFSSAQYVGMVRDPSRLNQIAWYYTPTSQVSPYLLGFNEPDLPGDTYVTEADAVTYWQQYFLPLRKSYGTILGAPAVTNAVATDWGIDWLNKFNAACQDTTTTPGTTKSCFDFIPLHWYGYYLSDFTTYITNFHNAYPTYPLWITEFAFTDHTADEDQVLTKQALAWLDAQPYVARYAQFGPMNAANMAGITGEAMVTDDLTALTNVGKVYHGVL